MNIRNLDKYYVWGIKALLFIIPFLSYWISKSMFFPYITGRNFAFRIFVEIGIVLWIGLIVLIKEYRPKFTSILTALLVFIAIVGIANVFGADPYHSFWSRYERMEGYLMMLHLLAYFILLTTVFRTKKDWLIFFNLFVIAGILVGSYGVLQVLGIKEAIQGGDVRIDGTIGNPTYLAAYLLLINALTLILFFNAEKRFWKYFYAAVLVFNLFITYFAASRGVTIALFAAVPLSLILSLLLTRKRPEEARYQKIVLGALVVIFLIPIGFLLVKNQKWVQESPVLSRFAAISFSEKTTRSRFYIWNIALQGFKENPVLGWGQENFIQVFSKYYDPRLYDQEPWFDRSHNIVLDWLINAGLLGLISYISLFIIFLNAVWRLVKSGKISLREGLVLLVAPVGYFIQNSFVFDNFNTYVIFFALLAYVDSLTRESANSSPNRAVIQERSKMSLIDFGCVALVAVPLLFFLNFRPAAQAKSIIDSLIATTDRQDPIGTTLATFQKTVSYNTFGRTETVEQLGRVSKLLLDNQGMPFQAKTKLIEYAINQLEDYLKDFPNDIRVHLFVGDIYQTLGSTVNLAFLDKAGDHFKTALELSPKKQQIIFALTNNYLAKGDLRKALELSQEAIDLEPSNLDAYANKAILLIISERNDLAQKVLEDMNQIRLSAKEEQNVILSSYIAQMQRVASLYVRFSQFSNARKIYQHLLELTPGNATIEAALAGIKGK